MKTSPFGIKKIAAREGTILHVYKDSKGLPTAGVGHLIKDSEHAEYPLKKSITQAQSDKWLAEDLKECEDAVNSIGVSLKQNEFDALVSLAFNIGVGGFKKSSVVRKLKAGDKSGAAEAILLWNKPPEIQGRRRTEYNQFKTPYKDSAQVPQVASTNANLLSENMGKPSDTLAPTNSETKVEVSADGGVKVQQSEGTPQPKERVAVVKGSKKRWTSAVWAKIVGIITGSAVFQWCWGQLEKIQDLQVPSNVWIIVSITGAIGTVLWIVHTIVDTWRANRNQERVDQLLVEQNSTTDNLVQLIPADEVDLYRLRGYKIITRGDAGVPLRSLTEAEKA